MTMDYFWDRNDSSLDEEFYRSFLEKNNIGKKIEDVIKESIEEKNDTVILEGSGISEIPVEFAYLDWVENLVIKNTSLKTIENLPKKLLVVTVKGNSNLELFDGNELPNTVLSINAVNNGITNVINLKNGMKTVNFSDNSIINFKSIIPRSVEELDLSENIMLSTVPIFEEESQLKSFNVENTRVECIDSLPDGITFLNTCKCEIQEVAKLPKELTVWKSYTGKIEIIKCSFPENIIEIDLFSNNLVTCPDFPISTKKIDLARNDLEKIPIFPMTCQIIELSGNIKLDSRDISKLSQMMNNTKIVYDFNTSQNEYTNLSWRNQSMRMLTRNTEYSNLNPHYIEPQKSYTL